MIGIGEDEFHLDDNDDRTVLRLENLRRFDQLQYETQDGFPHCLDSGYPRKPYRGSLFLNSARLRIDGRFTCAKLTMTGGYIYAQLGECAHQLLTDRIPFRYVPGRYHGKLKGNFWLWDMRVEAHGQEGIVQELQERIWKYERRRLDELLSQHDAAGEACVYLVDESNSAGAKVHFVFSNQDALGRVRFRSFVRDCRALQRPTAELAEAVEREKDMMAAYIDEQYAEVRRTHANVVRFPDMPKIRWLKGPCAPISK